MYSSYSLHLSIQLYSSAKYNLFEYLEMSSYRKRNTSDKIISGEVWVDELRLSGVKKDRGVAMRVQSTLKLADLGTANFTYSRQDADFHRLQERLSKGTSTSENFNISGRIDIHRLLPRSWGFSLPVNASISRATNTPKYFPGEDILVDKVAPPDTIISQSESISFSTSLSITLNSYCLFL